MAFSGVCCIYYVGLYNYIGMKAKRNLTRFESHKMFVLIKHSQRYYKRKFQKILKIKTINNEFD
jgi:hypothetical protein